MAVKPADTTKHFPKLDINGDGKVDLENLTLTAHVENDGQIQIDCYVSGQVGMSEKYVANRTSDIRPVFFPKSQHGPLALRLSENKQNVVLTSSAGEEIIDVPLRNLVPQHPSVTIPYNVGGGDFGVNGEPLDDRAYIENKINYLMADIDKEYASLIKDKVIVDNTIQGKVSLEITIDSIGHVTGVKVKDDTTLMNEEFIASLCNKFSTLEFPQISGDHDETVVTRVFDFTPKVTTY